MISPHLKDRIRKLLIQKNRIPISIICGIVIGSFVSWFIPRLLGFNLDVIGILIFVVGGIFFVLLFTMLFRTLLSRWIGLAVTCAIIFFLPHPMVVANFFLESWFLNNSIDGFIDYWRDFDYNNAYSSNGWFTEAFILGVPYLFLLRILGGVSIYIIEKKVGFLPGEFDYENPLRFE